QLKLYLFLPLMLMQAMGSAKTKFEQTLVENLYRAGKGHIKFGAIIACTPLQKHAIDFSLQMCFIKLEILIFRVHIFNCTCLDVVESDRPYLFLFWFLVISYKYNVAYVLPTGSFLNTHYCLYSGYL
ncbi:hypothetical protein ACJX0J_009149, partial [Zea mays]